MSAKMTLEIREELLKLRDEGLKLKGFISNGGIDNAFSEKPRLEETAPTEFFDLSPEAEGFVMELAENMIEKCSGFYKDGEDGSGECSIDPVDGETHIVMNWRETEQTVTDYSFDEIKIRAPDALSIIENVVEKIHQENYVDEIRRIEIEYGGYGDSMDGIDVAFFEEGDLDEVETNVFPSEIVDDLEIVADRLICGFGHEGFWNNEGGSGKVKIFCRQGGNLDVEYTHNDNLEYYEKEEFDGVCDEIIDLLNSPLINVRLGKPTM